MRDDDEQPPRPDARGVEDEVGDDEAWEDDEDDAPVDDTPPPEVTAEVFAEWRHPRDGTANPARLDNPVWRWLIRTGINAWRANQHFGESSFGSQPTWCFDRFGQSSTPLPDGRTVFIAGEHEDYYDPDFYIYRDVVVRHPDGRIDIYGYPKDVFPPTDFHSASLVDDTIVIIGNVGYPEQRTPDVTPVRVLDLGTFAIRTLATTGPAPSWIHRHAAAYSADGRYITVTGGQVLAGDLLLENIDDWRLHLDDGRWERLTRRTWPRWRFARHDGKRNHLWDYRQALWDMEFNGDDAKDPAKLAAELGRAPDFDAYAALYQPPVPFVADEGDEWNITRLTVNGVVVRYVDEMGELRVTVEGDLDPDVLDALTADLLTKLGRLEGVPWVKHTI